MTEENLSKRVERTGRIFWDWSKGDPPDRPGEGTVVLDFGPSRWGPRRHIFRQARKTHCPFCQAPVVLAATGRDPNLRLRHYFEPNGRKHWPNCSNQAEARRGVLLERRASL